MSLTKLLVPIAVTTNQFYLHTNVSLPTQSVQFPHKISHVIPCLMVTNIILSCARIEPVVFSRFSFSKGLSVTCYHTQI